MSQDNGSEYAVREVVSVFHSADDVETAIDNLALAGFARQNISIMASHDTIAQKLGHRFEQVKTVEDDAQVPSAYFVRKEDLSAEQAAAIGLPLYIGATAGALAVAATGGALALVAAAAAGGGLIGGGIGGIFATVIGDHHAKVIESDLEAGGILAWVRIDNEEEERKATEVLNAAGGKGTHTHDIKRTWGEKDVPLHDWQPDPLLR